MKFKLFSENAKLPTKVRTPDIGFDMYMPEAFCIKPLETKTIGLDVGFAVPEGFAGMLVPRSSIAEKGLIIQTSIIDPEYTGPVHLIITNCSNTTQYIEKHQRLCSLVVYSVLRPYIEQVDVFEHTNRDDKGLGSSGK